MESDRYKWIALSNTTLGVLLATLDASIILIAMPNIFRGIKLDPLVPANSFYLLWMILGYLVVTSVLIVSLGRLGDMYGRVRIYNLGFVIYTVASLLLAIDWMTGTSGATYLIGFRIVQGIGGACLLANAAAIITDAFPANQRGLALGINNIVGGQRHVRGAGAGRAAGADRLAAGVPDLGADRPVRHRLGLPQAGGAKRAATGPDRLVGQRHVRAGTGAGDGGGHLRHPPGRRPSHRLDEPQGAGADDRRDDQPDRLRDDRTARCRAHVPAAAVPDPGVHVRHALDVPVGGRARRPDVHADHLAAGHLAAAARLQLRADAALGRHLHAAADGRVPDRGADLGLPVRPLRRAPVRDRRHDRRGHQLRSADAAPDQLLLPRVRRHPAAERPLDGHVRLAQPGRGDEQPARQPTAAPAAA